MSTLVQFHCGNCGYGPLDIEDNRDAPIPNPPVSVLDQVNGEGRPLADCPGCHIVLPDFRRVEPSRG